jgi:hypothetical protein
VVGGRWGDPFSVAKSTLRKIDFKALIKQHASPWSLLMILGFYRHRENEMLAACTCSDGGIGRNELLAFHSIYLPLACSPNMLS